MGSEQSSRSTSKASTTPSPAAQNSQSQDSSSPVLGAVGKAFEAIDKASNAIDAAIIPSLPTWWPKMPAARLRTDPTFSLHLHMPGTPWWGFPPHPFPACFSHPTVGITTGWARALFSLMFGKPPYSVYINGMPAAQVGDGGFHFLCCGSNTYEIAMGASAVNIDGDRAARMLDVTAHCSMTRPPKPPDFPKGPVVPPFPPVPIYPGEIAAPGMIVGGSPNVIIGGFPLPSFKALIMKTMFKALGLVLRGFGKFVGKTKIGQWAGKQAQKVSDKIQSGRNAVKEAADRMLRRMGIKSEGVRMFVSNAICRITGEPIDVATGKVISFATDFSLPGFIPIDFKRVYSSASSYNGPLGLGWMHNFDIHISIIKRNDGDKFILFRNEEGRNIDFDYIDIGQQTTNSIDKIKLKRTATINDSRRKDVHSNNNTDNNSHLIKRDDYLIIEKEDKWFIFKDIRLKRENSNLFNLIEIRDFYNNSIKLNYNDNNQLSKIIDSAKREILLDYYADKKARLKEIRFLLNGNNNENNNVNNNDYSTVPTTSSTLYDNNHSGKYKITAKLVAFLYDDTQNYLTAAIDQHGGQMGYGYKDKLLSRLTDKNGYSYHFAYDANGYCIKAGGDDNAMLRQIQYDIANKTTREIDSLGKETVYQYNEFGLVEEEINVKRRKEIGKDGKEVLKERVTTTITTEWDEKANKKSFTDQLNNRTEFVYNQDNQLIHTIDPNNNITKYNYDEYGRKIEYTDKLNNSWSTTFDKEGNTTTQIDPLGRKWIYHFNDQGNVKSIVEPSKRKRKLYHDEFGNLAKIIDSSNRQTSYKYDIYGNVIQEYNFHGNKINYQYDGKNKITKIEREYDNASLFYSYDGEGNVIEFTDRNGHTTKYQYNGLNQLLNVINSNGQTINYYYNTETNLIAVVNENKEKTRYIYDLEGRIIRQSLFDGRELKYSYDSAGRVIEKTDGDIKCKISYKYDNNGNISQRQYPDKSITNYVYDSLDRLIETKTRDTTVRIDYDECGRITKEVQGNTGIEIEYIYDDADNIIELSTSNGRKIKYKYDNSTSLVRIDDTSCGIHEFAYDPLGRRVLHKFPNKMYARFYYDKLDRLVYYRLFNKKDDIIVERKYKYDANDRLTNIEDNQRGEKMFVYDSVGQLVEVKRQNSKYKNKRNSRNNIENFNATSNANNYEIVEKYEYDPSGNITRNNNYKNLTYTNGRLRSSDNLHYKYDSRGNLIEKQYGGSESAIQKFEYDFENRLKKVSTDNGKVIEYIYDHIGRRIAKIVDGKRTDFTWSGNTLIGQHGEDNDNDIDYLFMPNTFIPITQTDKNSNARYHYHLNHLYKPEMMTDDLAETVWREEKSTDAYNFSSNSTEKKRICPFGFPGQYYDEETGLYYNRYRYYDSSIGRYITHDPLELQGGINLYRYTTNPSNDIDPLGLIGDYGGKGPKPKNPELAGPKTADVPKPKEVDVPKPKEVDVPKPKEVDVPKPKEVDVSGIVEESLPQGPARPVRPGRPPATGQGAIARESFDRVRDGYAQRLGVPPKSPVHHAIELQVLDRYPGVYNGSTLNSFENMRGIGTEDFGRQQLHNSKIREIWDRHYFNLDREIATRGLQPGTSAYNQYVRRYLTDARDEVDYVLGQFFTEYRTGRPRSFQ